MTRIPRPTRGQWAAMLAEVRAIEKAGGTVGIPSVRETGNVVVTCKLDGETKVVKVGRDAVGPPKKTPAERAEAKVRWEALKAKRAAEKEAKQGEPSDRAPKPSKPKRTTPAKPKRAAAKPKRTPVPA